MPFENLTSENIMIYAVKAYDKPNCIMSEFTEDMKRFNYLKRLFKRYRKLNELREQLKNQVIPDKIFATWQKELTKFNKKRNQYLLY